MKTILRYVCTLALGSATVLAITTAPASGSDVTPAIAYTAGIANTAQATDSTTAPSKSFRVWEW
jgi:hypothetical protein